MTRSERSGDSDTFLSLEELAGVRVEVSEIAQQLEGLRAQYRRAGAAVKNDAAADVETIRQLLTEGVFLGARVADVGWIEMAGPLVPLALLFTYASIESNNHRRVERDRRCIYLRMAAIEAYTQSPLTSTESRTELEGILRKFVEQHFIAPDLDSNDVSSVSAVGLGSFGSRVRGRVARDKCDVTEDK